MLFYVLATSQVISGRALHMANTLTLFYVPATSKDMSGKYYVCIMLSAKIKMYHIQQVPRSLEAVTPSEINPDR